MIKNTETGYEEVTHTADVALKVWAPDMAGLFAQAAMGMVDLMDLQLDPEARVQRTIRVTGQDTEDLLVSFLQELLYLAEMHKEGYDRFVIRVAEDSLEAELAGGPITAQGKEIKAVTYHQLHIRETPRGVETVIVFDV